MMDVSLAVFITQAPLLFIAALFVLAFAVMLKSVKAILLELLLVVVMIGIQITAMPMLYTIIGAVQVLVGLYILYRFFKALNYNYQLILEKTHQTPLNITDHGQNGSRQSFL
ncbi:hypothetical protein JNUCC1_01541 [Lentibacillus sp. JNUCC-1]|uniref:hypothetical protein n=1 Tax=Lentibacillus sp. JNUCC-1 TaxID=2654513 RepID=UPI0012E836D3|nr:hypothetical protein [Lentibacillus sp. JNUCC-1]MUV37735.1 hypothetical protein [Lentibacillus sp. JNUCC-1]